MDIAMNLERLNVLLSASLVIATLFAPSPALAQSTAQSTAPSTALTETTQPTDNSGDSVARSIVEKADRVRFPSHGFEVDVTITGTTDGTAAEPRRYQILSKGNENTIVLTTEPAADRGQALLMRGRDLWIYMPNVSQPVRLSLSQRLTGQVANGDLARANFLGDYNPRIVRTEAVNGEPHHVLELKAIDKSVTYAKVLYWVKQSNGQPHRAEFYSISDRLLKSCRYENFKTLGGVIRPTRLVMEDALKKGNQSILEYADMKARDLPDRMFTKDYLKRL
jgi:outer membrane lipoprotein-sorting protein